MPTVQERFWAKVDMDGPVPVHRPDLGPCWVWTASILPTGYGQFNVGRKPDGRRWIRAAHRVSWDWEYGGIEEGLERDHLCRNRACVRPTHMEAVTHKVNSNRGIHANAEKTQCPAGHIYTPENTGRGRRGNGTTFRKCRTCDLLDTHRRRGPERPGHPGRPRKVLA